MLIPENVRSRVDSYDWLVSLVIMPVGFAVAGPLGASIGFTSTLVAAAIVLSVPCALVVLVPGIRGVHRTASGEIVGPAAGPVPASKPDSASDSATATAPDPALSATPPTES